MNKNISKLYEIAGKASRMVVGLMSGTSMDGLDIAVCHIEKSGLRSKVHVLNFETMPFTPAFRKQLLEIFSKRDTDLQQVCLMNEVVAHTHARLINEALEKWGYKAEDIDLIASHGQTIFHAPISQHLLEGWPNGTLQIGDGDHIAVRTGIITLSDFRQKHIAAGGEGAPLAVYGDYLLFSKKGEERVLLNIGGIANFTYLPSSADAAKVFSTDVGPGNTLMDQYMQKEFNRFYDRNAEVASAGAVDQKLLSALLDNDFFSLDFPKTTGPELFSLSYLEKAQQYSATQELPHADVMATLCAFSAAAIIQSLERAFGGSAAPEIYLSGGGMHNPLLVQQLKTGLKHARFFTTAELGIEPDAKEAVLFAVLANEAVAGKPVKFGDRKGIPAITMGKVSFPS